MEKEKSYNSQAEQQQTEVEKVLGSMPGFEGHMKNVQVEKENIQLIDPNNGGALLPTDQPNVLKSELSDTSYYITKSDEAIPLKIPINGGELTLTDRSDIMSSEYDDILYKVTEQGQIVPLKSPINGMSLVVSDNNTFEDPTTGQKFELDVTGKLNLRSLKE